MNRLKLILGASILLFVSGQANAAIIDNGFWTTDTNSGLDWLDLDLTLGMTIPTAAAIFNDDWRLATTSEYDDLFYKIFPNYEGNIGDAYDSGVNDDYDKHASQLDTFFSLFGEAPPRPILDPGWSRVQAFFLDEEGTGLDLMQLSLQRVEEVAKIDPHDYRGYDFDDAGSGLAGLFLVRDNCSGFPGGGNTGGEFPGGGNTDGCFPGKVPEPAVIWLFGTGLIGLVGFSKRGRVTCKIAYEPISLI